eukprot:109964-Rhodomonas_salina.1
MRIQDADKAMESDLRLRALYSTSQNWIFVPARAQLIDKRHAVQRHVGTLMKNVIVTLRRVRLSDGSHIPMAVPWSERPIVAAALNAAQARQEGVTRDEAADGDQETETAGAGQGGEGAGVD